MRIYLSPIRSEETLCARVNGEVLTLNGLTFDFSGLGDGSTLPLGSVGSGFVVDSIERIAGQLHVALGLPLAAGAPESASFPADIIDPADGALQLPGQMPGEIAPSEVGFIDWTKVVTAQQKAQAAAEQLLTAVSAETTRRRAVADTAIAPLQDAVDLDEATAGEEALLKEWKRYRIALNRLPDQSGYPQAIDWPAPPA